MVATVQTKTTSLGDGKARNNNDAVQIWASIGKSEDYLVGCSSEVLEATL